MLPFVSFFFFFLFEGIDFSFLPVFVPHSMSKALDLKIRVTTFPTQTAKLFLSVKITVYEASTRKNNFNVGLRVLFWAEIYLCNYFGCLREEFLKHTGAL